MMSDSAQPGEPDGEDENANDEEEEEVEGTPIEEAIEEIIGCATTSMSTILSPFLIGIIRVFAVESKIPAMYDIRLNDLLLYLMFGIFIAPFQVIMDILMNHATEVAHGVRIYDYMLYAKWRWKNRLTRWLFDDPSMDQSIAEPLQSANHLCFSPQFYFIETYYSWGMLMLLFAVTILVRWEMNPFDDPALGFLVLQQLVCNRVMNKVIEVMRTSVLWKPQRNAQFQVFSRSINQSMRRREAKMTEEKYRQWFLRRHAKWMISQLTEIFTPRARQTYKTKLSELYQQVLMLQPVHLYKLAGEPFPDPVAQDELPDNLRAELEDDDSSLSGNSSPRETIPPQMKLPPPPQLPALGGNMAQLPVAPPPPPAGAAMLQRLPPPALPRLPAPTTLATTAQGELPPFPPAFAQFGEGTPVAEAPTPRLYTPVAGLACRAWLTTARRRLQMMRLAEYQRREIEVRDTCALCGVTEMDPFVVERVGVWAQGAQLRVQATEDIRALVVSFEKHHGVPRVPFVEQQWRVWLGRHKPWSTVCVRCAAETGVQPLPLPEDEDVEEPQRALPSESGNGTLSPVASDSGSPSPRSPDSARRDDHSRYRGLPDVEVSPASREMLFYWATQARRRVKARRLAELAMVDAELYQESEEEEEVTDSSERPNTGNTES